MHVATIIRDNKTGRIHVRIGKAAQSDGDVTVIDVLNGADLRELKSRAERFVTDLEKRP